MSIYIRRISEFDARQFMPSDPSFDVQDYIDWVMSFDMTNAGTYITGANYNSQDKTLIVTWEEYGVGSWDNIVTEGMYGVIQTAPLTSYQITSQTVTFREQADFEDLFELKP